VATTRGRLVPINQPVLDQADFFESDGITRVLNLTIANISSAVFYNNGLLTWTLVDGAGVTDAQIVAGSLYFHEVTSGFYSVRFRPNAPGYWRTVLTYVAGAQVLAQDFDVASNPIQTTGLKASFTNC